MTFTMTLSYRTFSANIWPSAVAKRPFIDNDIRDDYVGYAIANKAAAHIGDISNVSPIFFGNDFPDAPPGLTSEMEPTHSLLFQLL